MIASVAEPEEARPVPGRAGGGSRDGGDVLIGVRTRCACENGYQNWPRRQTPKMRVVFLSLRYGDRAARRLVCHLQWCLAETAEIVAHGLSQVFQKRGGPRSGLSDNGAAMTAADITEGLSLSPSPPPTARRGAGRVTHFHTLHNDWQQQLRYALRRLYSGMSDSRDSMRPLHCTSWWGMPWQQPSTRLSTSA